MSLFHKIRQAVCACTSTHVYDLGAGLELHICERCLKPTYWLSIHEEQHISWQQEHSQLGGPEWKWNPILDIVKMKVGVD